MIMVALIVFEEDVVFGGILLNQAAFEHQGLKLAVGDNGVKIVYLADHAADLGVVVFIRSKILAYPVLSAFALPT